MIYPNIKPTVKHYKNQSMQMQGINLTDNYRDGQLESCKGISTKRFPYITTADQLQEVDAGITPGYDAVSMFAWEKLFVVSDEPGNYGGYKCFYGGEYCGDARNLDLPKQYAVINSKLVLWPDKVTFSIANRHVVASPMNTAPTVLTLKQGELTYWKGGETE